MKCLSLVAIWSPKMPDRWGGYRPGGCSRDGAVPRLSGVNRNSSILRSLQSSCRRQPRIAVNMQLVSTDLSLRAQSWRIWSGSRNGSVMQWCSSPRRQAQGGVPPNIARSLPRYCSARIRIKNRIDARRRRRKWFWGSARIVVCYRQLRIGRLPGVVSQVDARIRRMKNWRTESPGATLGVIVVKSNHWTTPGSADEYRIHLAGRAMGDARRLHVTQAAGSAWISSRWRG